MADIDVTIQDAQPINVSMGEAVNYFVSDVPGPQGEQGEQGEQGLPGSDGVIQSIVAGENITVDNTDPANPVISGSSGGGGGDGYELIGRHDFATNTVLSVDTPISFDLPAGTKELKIRWLFIEGNQSSNVGPYMYVNNNFTPGAYRSSYYSDNSYFAAADGYTMRICGSGSPRHSGEAYGNIDQVGVYPAFYSSAVGTYTANFLHIMYRAACMVKSTNPITSIQFIGHPAGAAVTVKAGSYIEVFGRAG